MTTLKLAITDFGQKNIQTGDIDDRAGVANVAAELGAEIHRTIQKARHDEHDSYASESQVEYVIPVNAELTIALSPRRTRYPKQYYLLRPQAARPLANKFATERRFASQNYCRHRDKANDSGCLLF